MTNHTIAKLARQLMFVAVAVSGLISAPTQAEAGIKYEVYGEKFDTSDPTIFQQMEKLDKALAELAKRKKNELKEALNCEKGGSIWVYDPIPEHVGFCWWGSNETNRVNRCNMLQHGVWVYGENSNYPALDLELRSGEEVPFGGIGGFCWLPTMICEDLEEGSAEREVCVNAMMPPKPPPAPSTNGSVVQLPPTVDGGVYNHQFCTDQPRRRECRR